MCNFELYGVYQLSLHLPKLGNNNIVQRPTDKSTINKTAIKLNEDFSTSAPLTFVDQIILCLNVDFRMFSKIPGLYPVNASSIPPSYENQKSLQILPSICGREISLWLKTTHPKQACCTGMPAKFLGPNAK